MSSCISGTDCKRCNAQAFIEEWSYGDIHIWCTECGYFYSKETKFGEDGRAVCGEDDKPIVTEKEIYSEGMYFIGYDGGGYSSTIEFYDESKVERLIALIESEEKPKSIRVHRWNEEKKEVEVTYDRVRDETTGAWTDRLDFFL